MWEEKRNVYRLLIRKTERESHLGKSRILTLRLLMSYIY